MRGFSILLAAVGGLGCAGAAPAAVHAPLTRTLDSGADALPSPVQAAPDVDGSGATSLAAWDGDTQTSVSSSLARCPEEMALVDDRVCVDRWEGIVVEVVDGVEHVWSPYQSLDEVDATALRTGRLRAASRPDVVPQGYISGAQAELACRAAGKRLCSSDEWVLACRGPEDTQFPYSDQREDGHCNDTARARHPVVEAASRAGLPEASYWREGMNLPEINQLPDSLAHTGEHEQCATGEGISDMVGNLHEWTDDRAGTFRGGFYMDTSQNGEGCSYSTTGHDFGYHDYSTGFRCCMDAYEVE